MAVAIKPSAFRARSYRFAGVVVDEGATRLVVDGRPCACSQRALHLLLIFCESPQRTLSRAELMDRLWPGGQEIADEALTQAVFRARAVLGSHAACIVTVRGIGFRLDSEVMSLDDDGEDAGAVAVVESGIAPTPDTALANQRVESSGWSGGERRARPSTVTPVRHRRWLLAAGGLLLLSLLALAGWFWFGRSVAITPIESGYGIRPGDVGSDREETAGLLREAFANEAEGDRARARALLEIAHSSDAVSPIPALFLALWAVGSGDMATADQWLLAAEPRVARMNSPYVSALLAYVRAESNGSSQDILRQAGALLDQRPDAWQMHLARGHLLMYEGFREAALKELKAIDYSDFSHRKLMTALADRASLGDVAAVRVELAALAAQQPASARLDYVRGRVAWSSGDLDEAVEAFERCVAEARQGAQFDLLNRSMANLGAIAVIRRRDAEAVSLLEQARSGMVQSGWITDEVDLSLMLAQMNALAGRAALVEAELLRAERVVARSESESMRGLVALYRQRLAPGDDGAPIVSSDDPRLRLMLHAQRALTLQQRDQARQLVADAANLVPPSNELFDELRILAVQVGVALPAAPPVDPPYPPLSRLTSRAVLDQLQQPSDEVAP